MRREREGDAIKEKAKKRLGAGKSKQSKQKIHSQIMIGCWERNFMAHHRHLVMLLLVIPTHHSSTGIRVGDLITNFCWIHFFECLFSLSPSKYSLDSGLHFEVQTRKAILAKLPTSSALFSLFWNSLNNAVLLPFLPSTHTFLHIHTVPAHFIQKYSLYSVKRGESAKLVCESFGTQPIGIQWLRQDSTDSRLTPLAIPMFGTTEFDAGSNTRSSSIGSGSSSEDVTKFNPLSYGWKGRRKSSSSAAAAASDDWSQGSKSSGSNSRFSAYQRDYSGPEERTLFELQILSTQLNDTALYVCKISNEFGDDTRNMDLTILGMKNFCGTPSFPSFSHLTCRWWGPAFRILSHHKNWFSLFIPSLNHICIHFLSQFSTRWLFRSFSSQILTHSICDLFPWAVLSMCSFMFCRQSFRSFSLLSVFYWWKERGFALLSFSSTRSLVNYIPIFCSLFSRYSLSLSF